MTRDELQLKLLCQILNNKLWEVFNCTYLCPGMARHNKCRIFHFCENVGILLEYFIKKKHKT